MATRTPLVLISGEVQQLQSADTLAGVVTNVGMTVPTGLSVLPASITSSGTFAITTTLSGVLKGTGSGFAAAVAGTDYVTPSGNITGTAANVTGTVAIAHGGTGQTTAAAGFNALSPLTTLGDVLYASAANTGARLAGNTTTTRKFLRQTGTGTVSAAPAWDTVTATDVGLGSVENTALSTWAGSANLTTLGTVATGTWNATTIAIAHGGTGATTAAAGFNALSPLTTLGDLIYASAASTNSRLAGNTASTKKFLTQTGTGTVSAAPAWAAIAAADVPVFVASGASHAAGAVPDPGSTAGSTRYLREDATWATPTGSGGMAIGSAVTSGTSGGLLYVDASGNLADSGMHFDVASTSLGIGISNPQDLGNLAVGGTSSTFVNFSCTGTLGSGSLILMQFTDAAGTTGYDFGISSTTSTDFGIRVLNGGGTPSPFHIDQSANISLGVASPATTATSGLVYLPAMAGAPTGTPGSKTGLAPVVIDSTNKKIWAYLGGTWVGTALT